MCKILDQSLVLCLGLCLALIAILSGCGGGSSTHSVNVDGVTVTVIQPPGNHVFSGETSGGYTKQKDAATGLEFIVKDKELSVNGKKYGKLSTGDTARIQDGKVFVNDKERLSE